jgi:hypothetical protein
MYCSISYRVALYQLVFLIGVDVVIEPIMILVVLLCPTCIGVLLCQLVLIGIGTAPSLSNAFSSRLLRCLGASTKVAQSSARHALHSHVVPVVHESD